MKPRTILILAFLIFACVIACMLGNFGAGVAIPINGQDVTFKAFVPKIVVPAEIIGEPWFEIAGVRIGLYNTLLTTLIVDAVIIVLVLLGRRGLGGMKPGNWFANAWEAYIELLYQRFIVPTLGPRAKVVLPLAVTLFTFVLIASLFEVIPGHESIGPVEHPHSGKGYCLVEVGGVGLITGQPVDEGCPAPTIGSAGGEAQAALASDVTAAEGKAGSGFIVLPVMRRPTSDLSTTLALALIAFLFVEIQGIRANGGHYFERFFNFGALRRGGATGGMSGFINYIQFAVGFLELLSEFIRIISFSFRLFGNMFAGTVLVFVMSFILPFVMPTIFMAFEVAVAVIQAFVFMMLLVVFTSLAVAHTEH